MKIGFIGLGHMGSAVAANLLAAGHELTVWNRSPAPAKALADKGARVASEPGETLQGEVVFSMLANDSAIQDVGFGGPLLSAAKAGLVHVNLATISVDLAESLANAHSAFGLGYVAAPVFGRPDIAATGNLTIVAAGSPADVASVRPLLEIIGGLVAIVGDRPEQANLFKLAGNFMLSAAVESMSEAFALVRKAGIDARLFHDTLSASLYACPVYRTYGDAIANERFEPAGFPLKLAMKDVRLVLEAAQELHTPIPLADLVHGHFMEASLAGFADKDLASLGGFLANKAGLAGEGVGRIFEPHHLEQERPNNDQN